jgi:methylenetetrahydrofolate reductase (NADPH)
MNRPELKPRIVEFMLRASTEVTVKDERLLPELADILPPGAAVYVAHTPKVAFDEVMRVAVKVQRLGLRASPHLVARLLPGEAALREGLEALKGGGVEQALLVAGDRAVPLGPYASTLDVIASDVLARSGLRHLGVAGHPEGHPYLTTEQLWHALRLKQQFGQRTGIAMHVVTQFGFNPGGVHNWAAQSESHGIALPVHCGIAGPTPLTALLRYAMQCGVGASMQSAARTFTYVGRVARQARTVEHIVPALVALGAGSEESCIVQPHFFAFGGALATARWMQRVGSGAFEVRSDGDLVLSD